MDLDELSTDGSVTDVSPRDFKVTLLYVLEDSCTPVGSLVFSSDEDLPLSAGREDRRKVRKRDTRPLSPPGLIDDPAPEPTPRKGPVETKTVSLMDEPPEGELPVWSHTEIMPLIIIENSSVVEKPKTTDGLLRVAGLTGIQHATGRGRFAAGGDYAAPAVKLCQFQRPVLRSTDCVCSMPRDAGSRYSDDSANI